MNAAVTYFGVCLLNGLIACKSGVAKVRRQHLGKKALMSLNTDPHLQEIAKTVRGALYNYNG